MRLFESYYDFLLRRCRVILADTQASAKYSSDLSGIDLNRYKVIPVGADERVFKPAPKSAKTKKSTTFSVFYYSNMLPLHGLKYTVEAAVLLKGEPINFLFVGGDEKTADLIYSARVKGAHIEHKFWIDFEKLPIAVRAADICLAGPFGNTPQSQLVTTGKTYQFLACRAPTIVGRSQANLLFHDKRDCLMVEQGNAGSLADAILWAYRHRKDLPKIGASGYELYQKHFSSTVIARKLADVLDDLK